MAGVSDEEGNAQRAYLAEGNARQARKRVAVDVLLYDTAGRVLLVNPSYKPRWDLPGGMAEANEPPRAAAERELREELGLSIGVDRLLVLDWDGPHGPWDDQLVFIFDGGTLSDDQVATLRIEDAELSDFAFIPPNEAEHLLRADMAQRLARAARALGTNTTDYGESEPGSQH